MKVLNSVCLLFISVSVLGNTKKLNTVVQKQHQTQKEETNSQIKINKLDDETQKLLQIYRVTLKNIHNTKIYNQQLRDLIKNQKTEMVSLRQQIEQVKDTRQDILPLISRMIDSLDQFIDLDLPFLLEQRKGRVAELKSIMKKSNISVSEKYRRLLTIYEIENEYGRTISAYKGIQVVNNKSLTVDFLRVGRIALIYQTLNRKYMGYWNHKENTWKPLSSSYKEAVYKGLAIAKKQLAPDLLKIPIFSPKKEGTLLN